MSKLELRIENFAAPLQSGDQLAMPRKMLHSQHEALLSALLVTDMPLFGMVYRGLVGPYFDTLHPYSGALVGFEVPTSKLTGKPSKPGDLDLIIVPYKNGLLEPAYTLVCEVKAIRAEHANQGKPPNKTGVRQAKALLELGLPFVGLIHLIVSDRSPKEEWQTGSIAEVIDEDTQEIAFRGELMSDHMPRTLLDRAFGRLKKAKSNLLELGIASVYIGPTDDLLRRQFTWHPLTQSCAANSSASADTVMKIATYLAKNPGDFINIPKSK